MEYVDTPQLELTNEILKEGPNVENIPESGLSDAELGRLIEKAIGFMQQTIDIHIHEGEDTELHIKKRIIKKSVQEMVDWKQTVIDALKSKKKEDLQKSVSAVEFMLNNHRIPLVKEKREFEALKDKGQIINQTTYDYAINWNDLWVKRYKFILDVINYILRNKKYI